MKGLQEIYVKNLNSTDEEDEEVVITIEGGAATVENLDVEITGPIPLRVSGKSDPSVSVTALINVYPEDPKFALALQEHLPDGLVVTGAKVSGKLLSWGDLITLGKRSNE